jgi:hypothetical protein
MPSVRVRNRILITNHNPSLRGSIHHCSCGWLYLGCMLKDWYGGTVNQSSGGCHPTETLACRARTSDDWLRFDVVSLSFDACKTITMYLRGCCVSFTFLRCFTQVSIRTIIDCLQQRRRA